LRIFATETMEEVVITKLVKAKITTWTSPSLHGESLEFTMTVPLTSYRNQLFKTIKGTARVIKMAMPD